MNIDREAGPAFVKAINQDCSHWRCNPTADDTHRSLLALLKERVGGVFLQAGYRLNERHMGNLGEFITCCIGVYWHSSMKNYRPFPANAFEPLTNNSRPGLDLVWIFFGRTPDDDVAALQEVKTTGTEEIKIAYDLNEDYRKLFGTDPSLTLKPRMSAVKSKLELAMGRSDLAKRINKFICINPSLCTSTTVLPTVVYDCQVANPETVERRLVFVRTTLAGMGWDAGRIETWAVGIEELEERLARLATGG